MGDALSVAQLWTLYYWPERRLVEQPRGRRSLLCSGHLWTTCLSFFFLRHTFFPLIPGCCFSSPLFAHLRIIYLLNFFQFYSLHIVLGFIQLISSENTLNFVPGPSPSQSHVPLFALWSCHKMEEPVCPRSIFKTCSLLRDMLPEPFPVSM